MSYLFITEKTLATVYEVCNKPYTPPLYQVGLVAIPFYVNNIDWIINVMKEHITKLNKFSHFVYENTPFHYFKRIIIQLNVFYDKTLNLHKGYGFVISRLS